MARMELRTLLRVGDGAGSLEHGEVGQDVTQLASGAIAAMFAGTPMGTLRGAGLVSGGAREHDAALDAAFTGDAYLLDYF